MGDRYDGMSKEQLLAEAQRRNIKKFGGSEDSDGQVIDKGSKSDLQEVLRATDEAQEADAGEDGTSSNADRSGQRPGAGDPRVAHDAAAGRGEKDANVL